MDGREVGKEKKKKKVADKLFNFQNWELQIRRSVIFLANTQRRRLLESLYVSEAVPTFICACVRVCKAHLSSRFWPTHTRPPWRGVGLLQERWRTWKPMPQLVLQGDQDVQGVQAPFLSGGRDEMLESARGGTRTGPCRAGVM